MSTGPILLFGAGGQLGRELTELAAARGRALTGLDRTGCDITDPRAVAAAVIATRPTLLVNAAAYTAVDRAEDEEEAAFAANATGPGVIAAAAARAGLPLLHLSTDYVFDGRLDRPYRANDPTAPLGVYGRSKLAGEAAVRQALDRHVILRTAWVYGRHGGNFLKTMLRLAGERDGLSVVDDQIGRPTATADLAQAVLAVADHVAAGDEPWGLYHFAGPQTVSWCGFARAIMAEWERRGARAIPVTAIGTADYPTKARRPANSALDSSLFGARFGYDAAPLRDRIAEAVAALCRQ